MDTGTVTATLVAAAAPELLGDVGWLVPPDCVVTLGSAVAVLPGALVFAEAVVAVPNPAGFAAGPLGTLPVPGVPMFGNTVPCCRLL